MPTTPPIPASAMPEILWVRQTYARKSGAKFTGVEKLTDANNSKPHLQERIQYRRADLPPPDDLGKAYEAIRDMSEWLAVLECGEPLHKHAEAIRQALERTKP
jgi:hypothetical protein